MAFYWNHFDFLEEMARQDKEYLERRAEERAAQKAAKEAAEAKENKSSSFSTTGDAKKGASLFKVSKSFQSQTKRH